MGFYNDDFVFNERIVCTTCLREMWNIDSFFFFLQVVEDRGTVFTKVFAFYC